MNLKSGLDGFLFLMIPGAVSAYTQEPTVEKYPPIPDDLSKQVEKAGNSYNLCRGMLNKPAGRQSAKNLILRLGALASLR